MSQRRRARSAESRPAQHAVPASGRQRPSEQILVDERERLRGPRVLCRPLGPERLARGLNEPDAVSRLTCHFFDLYLQQRASERLDSTEIRCLCTADLPDEEFDSIVLPLSAQGEAELTRELLQDAHQRLVVDGCLLAATDNPQDQWLHSEMQDLFPKVTRVPHRQGVLYVGRRKGPLKRIRDFTATFAFRDRGRLFQVATRPGVFSHRRLDLGARALMDSLEVEDGARVLDLGCGSGVLTVCALGRGDGIQVDAVDSNARAVACTAETCSLNGFESRVTTHLNADENLGWEATHDLVMANPPYFSNFRIAGIFLEIAVECLKPGGRLVLVTKQGKWFEDHLPDEFTDVRFEDRRTYTVIHARRL